MDAICLLVSAVWGVVGFALGRWSAPNSERKQDVEDERTSHDDDDRGAAASAATDYSDLGKKAGWPRDEGAPDRPDHAGLDHRNQRDDRGLSGLSPHTPSNVRYGKIDVPPLPDTAEAEPSDEIDSTENQQHHVVLEQKCRAFLDACADRDMSLEQARSWFDAQGLNCEAIDIEGNRDTWHLLLVSKGSMPSGLGVPAMRRAMGSVPLSTYFRLLSYNGLNPLGPQNVHSFCRIRLKDRTVMQQGIIDGQ